MDKEKISVEAKKILDSFSQALDKVKNDDYDFYVQRNDFERLENGNFCQGFKSELLKNAPKKNNDFIITERGSWKDNVKTKN